MAGELSGKIDRTVLQRFVNMETLDEQRMAGRMLMEGYNGRLVRGNPKLIGWNCEYFLG